MGKVIIDVRFKSVWNLSVIYGKKWYIYKVFGNRDCNYYIFYDIFWWRYKDEVKGLFVI